MINACAIIPVFNEEIVLLDTINALCSAGFEKSNIYIINDCSTDNTEQVAISSGVNVFTPPSNGGKAKAQIAGIEHFKLLDRYDWVIFLDGDTKVGYQFKEELYTIAKEHSDVSLFVGQVMSAEDKHVFSALRAIDYTVGQNFIKKGQDNFNVIFVSPGCASMYSTAILRKLNLDTDVLAEDMDLTIQVHKEGGKVMYVHGAHVYTQDPDNLKDYMKQINRWYRGFWQVAVKHKLLSFKKKIRVEWYMLYLMLDTLFLNKIVLFLLWLYLTSSWLSVVCALAVDFTMVALTALYTFYKTKRTDVLTRLPLIYLLTYASLYAFVKSFVEVVILRKKNFGWNKVQRHKF